MTNFKIELGAKVKSIISGYNGMVTSRSEHLNGCNRYWVAPTTIKDGELKDGYWFDEQELEVTAKPTAKIKKVSDAYKTNATEKRGGFPSQIK